MLIAHDGLLVTRWHILQRVLWQKLQWSLTHALLDLIHEHSILQYTILLIILDNAIIITIPIVIAIPFEFNLVIFDNAIIHECLVFLLILLSHSVGWLRDCLFILLRGYDRAVLIVDFIAVAIIIAAVDVVTGLFANYIGTIDAITVCWSIVQQDALVVA